MSSLQLFSIVGEFVLLCGGIMIGCLVPDGIQVLLVSGIDSMIQLIPLVATDQWVVQQVTGVVNSPPHVVSALRPYGGWDLYQLPRVAEQI